LKNKAALPSVRKARDGENTVVATSGGARFVLGNPQLIQDANQWNPLGEDVAGGGSV
jgi:hypothetical protein